MQYLDRTDPNAFLDMEKRKKEDFLYKDMEIVECPKCKGYGGWHLRLNAYGEGQHFNASCDQCTGWGYVEKGSKDETCDHEYEEIGYEEAMKRGIRHFGACDHVTECKKCGQIRCYDSSG